MGMLWLALILAVVGLIIGLCTNDIKQELSEANKQLKRIADQLEKGQK